jgi:uncharacterized Fe-S cluster-containing MiaB family protein
VQENVKAAPESRFPKNSSRIDDTLGDVVRKLEHGQDAGELTEESGSVDRASLRNADRSGELVGCTP